MRSRPRACAAPAPGLPPPIWSIVVEEQLPLPCGRGLGGGGCAAPAAPSPQPPPARGGGELVAAFWSPTRSISAASVPAGAIGVSALTGEGLDALRARLAEAARSLTESAGPPPLTQARHRAALQEAAARLAGARTADLPELRAEDLRLALRALGRITGSVGVEDILDTLFARFCIGK